jgi:8-oxo-dGTP pyrophosphatase MutT (NUDIX family)
MAAELSYGRHSGPTPYGTREAAVVIVLYRHHGVWYVLLTVRSAELSNHSGQISLPGGAVDAGETTRAAALRELEEELGIPGSELRVAGSLSTVYVFASNFHVIPWVGFLDCRATLTPNPAEVSRVLEVPLGELAAPANRGWGIITRGAVRFRAPHYVWQGHRIWGGTAMILSELIAVLRQVHEFA